MNPSKPLAQAVRRLAREKLRASEAHWKEYKRMRRSRLWYWLHQPGFIFLIFPALLFPAFAQRDVRELPLVLLALYSTATVFGRSILLANTLYRSRPLAFFMHAPVTDAQFFDHQWRGFLRNSLLVGFYSFLAFGCLALTSTIGYSVWPAVVIAATLQWLLVVSLIVALQLVPTARPEGLNFGFFPCLLLYLLAFAALFLPPTLIEPLQRILLPLPTAWIPYVFESVILRHEHQSLYLLVPTLALFFFLPVAARRLRATYPVVELSYPLARPSRVNGSDVKAAGPEKWMDTQEKEAIRSTEPAITPIHLQLLNWSAGGWIERLTARWLSQRERETAEFLCGGRLGFWSAQWRRALKVFMVGGLALILRSVIPSWIGAAVGAIASMFALPLLGGHWEGMQLRSLAGMRVMPVYASFPLSFGDMSRVIAKVNLIRYAVGSPFFLAYCALLAWREHLPPLFGLRMGGEILVILLSIQPFFIASRLSFGTNDTSRLNLHTLLGFLALAPLAIAYFTCMVILLLAAGWAPERPRAWPAIAATAGMFLCSSLSWFGYKLFYDRGRVDLLRIADNQ